MDTTPLRNYLSEVLHAVNGELTGIQYNLARGKLKAVALSTSSYTTGQSLTWIQGRDLHDWTRPQRRSQQAVLTIDHVMASSAFPCSFRRSRSTMSTSETVASGSRLRFRPPFISAPRRSWQSPPGTGEPLPRPRFPTSRATPLPPRFWASS